MRNNWTKSEYSRDFVPSLDRLSIVALGKGQEKSPEKQKLQPDSVAEWDLKLKGVTRDHHRPSKHHRKRGPSVEETGYGGKGDVVQ